MTKKKQTAPKPLKDEALDKAAGGWAWHEAARAGQVVAPPTGTTAGGGPHVKAFDGRGGG